MMNEQNVVRNAKSELLFALHRLWCLSHAHKREQAVTPPAGGAKNPTINPTTSNGERAIGNRHENSFERKRRHRADSGSTKFLCRTLRRRCSSVGMPPLEQ